MVNRRDYEEECALLTQLNHQVAVYAVFMGLPGLVFFYIGVSIGWLYVCDIIISWDVNMCANISISDVYGSHLRFHCHGCCVMRHLE